MTDENQTAGGQSGAASNDRLAAILAIYNEHNTDRRWQEECREKSSSAIIAANSIIVGIIAAFDLQFSFIIFCGVQYMLASTGQRFILKYHALSDRRHAYVSELQNLLVDASGSRNIGKLLADIRTKQAERLRATSKLGQRLMAVDKKTSIHELWYHLHSGFKAMSILLAVVIVALDLQHGRPGSMILQIWDNVAGLLKGVRFG